MIDDDLGCNLKHNCQQYHHRPDDDDGSGRYHHHWGSALLGNLVIGYSYIIIGESFSSQNSSPPQSSKASQLDISLPFKPPPLSLSPLANQKMLN